MTRDEAAARRAVEAEMGDRGWDIQRLSQEAGLDPGTVGDFLSGARWPRIPTRGSIERALGWQPGRLAEIADGVEPRTVGGEVNDADLFVFRRPPGMGDREWERLRRSKQAEMEALFDEYGDG